MWPDHDDTILGQSLHGVLECACSRLVHKHCGRMHGGKLGSTRQTPQAFRIVSEVCLVSLRICSNNREICRKVFGYRGEVCLEHDECLVARCLESSLHRHAGDCSP